jgi:uncharacterized protein (TIGR02145 family)
MKTIIQTVLVILFVILISSCEKDEPAPNEIWVAGGKWIDTRDGHLYGTIPIGDQIWLAENMAYLPSVNNVEEGSEDEGKGNGSFYYVYGYDGTDALAAKATSEYSLYGVLYNYNAALNACPDGWHLPTDIEWMELESCLGMSSTDLNKTGYRGTDEGMRMKATWGWGINIWMDKNGNGNNETGYTALPGGLRWNEWYNLPSVFIASTTWGCWWSTTKIASDPELTHAWYRELSNVFDNIYRSQVGAHSAMSVRCIKD